jgi:hypothetical protein
MFGTLTK